MGQSRGGSGSGYWANISVRDQNNNPVAGVTVQLYVSVWVANELEGRGATGVTDSQGRLYLIVFVKGSNQVLSTIRTRASKSGWTILSESGTSSSTREYITPSYVMIVDTDGNGIADQNEYALAAKFAPTLYLSHPTKWLAPEPVDITASIDNLFCVMWYITGQIYAEPLAKLVAHSNLHKLVYSNGNYSHNTKELEKDLYCIADNSTDVSCDLTPGVMSRVLFFDWPGNVPSEWNSAYSIERLSNQFAHTTYAHLFKSECNYVIQYWFYYPYNDFVNNHEGDWEHINVNISSQNPSVSNIVSVDYYFHHRVQRRVRGFDLDYEDSSHPRVYVGGKNPSYSGTNSGGSYPERGYWPDVVQVVGSTTSPDERVDADGPVLKWSSFADGNPNDRRGLVVLKNPDKYDYNSDPSMSWLKANVHWGASGSASPWDWVPYVVPVVSDIGNNSPVGPYYNNGWEKSGVVPGKYDSYTIRPH